MCRFFYGSVPNFDGKRTPLLTHKNDAQSSQGPTTPDAFSHIFARAAQNAPPCRKSEKRKD